MTERYYFHHLAVDSTMRFKFIISIEKKSSLDDFLKSTLKSLKNDIKSYRKISFKRAL